MAIQDYAVKRGSGSPNICFDCKKACGDCSWSEVDPNTRKVRYEPVPGWTAEKVFLNVGYSGYQRRLIETYCITACPEFEKDERTEESCVYEISDEAFKKLLSQWRRLGEI